MTLETAKIKTLLSQVLSQRVLRFAIVGAFNTLVNFIILNISFYELGISKISSNIVATSCALIISFYLNRNFVFAHKGHWLKQFLTFAIVTAIGTLAINNLVYIVALHLLKSVSSDFIQINGSAVIATLFSMVWNYTGYRLIVFKKVNTNEETI